MTNVAFRAVRKSYGPVEVVHGVSFDIEPGEFVALVGPSGCGKSTLLRMVAGLESISGGEVLVGDRVINRVEPKDRDIAMVFQNYALYPHMTVAENMGFSLRLRNVPKAEREEPVRRAAQILGLGDLLERYPGQLSGGQRQRVAMGRAIVRAPKVFLFDEPLSNLDAKLRVKMRTELKEMHQRLRTTTIYVTHDQVEAMTLADKIVVMHDGIVEQAGAPMELYDQPANLFVAGFIGSPAMNLVAGTLRSAPSPHLLSDGGAMLPLSAIPHGWDGKPVIYGIRPEDFGLSDGDIEGNVVVVEATGSETQVTIQVGRDQLVGVFRERVTLAPGAPIGLKPNAAKVHLFDPATRARIDQGHLA